MQNQLWKACSGCSWGCWEKCLLSRCTPKHCICWQSLDDILCMLHGNHKPPYTRSNVDWSPSLLIEHSCKPSLPTQSFPSNLVARPIKQGQPFAAQMACLTSTTGIWSWRTCTSIKRKVSDTNLQAAVAQGLQHCNTKPAAPRPRRRSRRSNKAHMPLLSRECRHCSVHTYAMGMVGAPGQHLSE